MSHGQHRKPRTTTRRLRRAVAGLSLAAAAATGGLLASGDLTTASGDTAWGAPDTTAPADSDAGTDTGTETGGTVTPLDTAWG